MIEYRRSIEGINREIKLRQSALRKRKSWYLHPVVSSCYTMTSFYIVGYRKMKEIEKLKKIRQDLVLCIDML